MINTFLFLSRRSPAGRSILFSAFLAFGTMLLASPAANAQATAGPWSASQLLAPVALVKSLSAKRNQKPLLLHVGFKFLYSQGHIPGSIEVGPASEPEGIASLKKVVHNIPHSREVVLYCGCCPWTDCPNIRPAFQTMRKLGFTRIRVLYLPHNFKTDWIQKKYPITK